MKQKSLSNLILLAYALMMIVSLVSAVDLFKISHPFFIFGWIMSIAIEISIATLLMINRAAPSIKSAIYVLGFITLFQICANTYSAYIHIEDIAPFAELFAIDDWEIIDQKRVLAFATGGVLPAICLALIYIQNEVRMNTNEEHPTNNDPKPIEDKSNESEKDIIDNDEHVESEDKEESQPEQVSDEVPLNDNNAVAVPEEFIERPLDEHEENPVSTEEMQIEEPIPQDLEVADDNVDNQVVISEKEVPAISEAEKEVEAPKKKSPKKKTTSNTKKTSKKGSTKTTAKKKAAKKPAKKSNTKVNESNDGDAAVNAGSISDLAKKIDNTGKDPVEVLVDDSKVTERHQKMLNTMNSFVSTF